jgi:hypothetical protein
VEPPPISAIEFTLNEDDFTTLGEFTVTKSRFFRRRFIRGRLVNFFVPPFGLLIPGTFDLIRHNRELLIAQTGHVTILIVSAILFGGLWGSGEWVYRLARIRRAVRRQLRDGTHTKCFTPAQVELLPDGIRHTGELGTNLTPWSAIIDVVVNKSAAYVYITSVAALIIPRRVFADQAAFDVFVGQIVKRQTECAQARGPCNDSLESNSLSPLAP